MLIAFIARICRISGYFISTNKTNLKHIFSCDYCWDSKVTPTKSKSKAKAYYEKLVMESRAAELKHLEQILKSEDSTGDVCVIIGDRGSGKSEVFKAALKLGKSLGFVLPQRNKIRLWTLHSIFSH